MESRGRLSSKDKIMTPSIRRCWGIGAFLFMLAVLWGCAAAPAPAPKPRALYDANLPPNIRTVEEARADLAALLKVTNIFTNYNDVGVCRAISRDTFYSRYPHVSKYGLWENGQCFFYASSVEVFSDRIDFPPAPLRYEDLRGFKLTVRDGYLIDLPNRMNVAFRVEDSERISNRFADDLYFIQQNVNANHVEKMAAFREKAERYRSTSVKPAISEEQRKYIVQANALTQQKDYAGAVDCYQKALEIDATSYPAAYFNMALLHAQERRFERAIESMNQYLLLEPDAKDARSARDKIYEWELMAPKTMQRN